MSNSSEMDSRFKNAQMCRICVARGIPSWMAEWEISMSSKSYLLYNPRRLCVPVTRHCLEWLREKIDVVS